MGKISTSLSMKLSENILLEPRCNLCLLLQKPIFKLQNLAIRRTGPNATYQCKFDGPWGENPMPCELRTYLWNLVTCISSCCSNKSFSNCMYSAIMSIGPRGPRWRMWTCCYKQGQCPLTSLWIKWEPAFGSSLPVESPLLTVTVSRNKTVTVFRNHPYLQYL